VRAEKALVPVPPFLRRCREAPRVEHPFVLAQVRQETQLFRERVHAGESAAAFFCTGEKWRSFARVASAGLAPANLVGKRGVTFARAKPSNAGSCQRPESEFEAQVQRSEWSRIEVAIHEDVLGAVAQFKLPAEVHTAAD